MWTPVLILEVFLNLRNPMMAREEDELLTVPHLCILGTWPYSLLRDYLYLCYILFSDRCATHIVGYPILCSMNACNADEIWGINLSLFLFLSFHHYPVILSICLSPSLKRVGESNANPLWNSWHKGRQFTNQKCHINPISFEGWSLDG